MLVVFLATVVVVAMVCCEAVVNAIVGQINEHKITTTTISDQHILVDLTIDLACKIGVDEDDDICM